VVLTAGDPGAMPIFLDALLQGIVEAVEEETRFQVGKYAGTWSSRGSVSAELELEIDDGPGLKLMMLERNGSSIVEGLMKFWPLTLAEFGPLDPELRLYPADIRNESIFRFPNTTKDVEVIREDWRITFSTLPNTAERTASELPGQGAMGNFCTSWQLADWVYYGGEAVDRVVFVLDKETEEILGIEVPFLRVWLEPKE
jgi:hypothetical protein